MFFFFLSGGGISARKLTEYVEFYDNGRRRTFHFIGSKPALTYARVHLEIHESVCVYKFFSLIIDIIVVDICDVRHSWKQLLCIFFMLFIFILVFSFVFAVNWDREGDVICSHFPYKCGYMDGWTKRPERQYKL